MNIQTLAVPGCSKEGFLSHDAAQAQALAQTAETFAKVYAFPALFVVDITVEASHRPGERDATVQPTVHVMSLINKNADAFRYLHEVSFLVKRPGNPFPQFVSVGRAANNDIVFSVDSVSKFHGYFTIEKDQWLLTDFRSTNGTLLNGKKLDPTVATPVKDGDRIRFGDHVTVQFLEPLSLHAKLRG